MTDTDSTIHQPEDDSTGTNETRPMETPVLGQPGDERETISLKSRELEDDPLLGAQIGNYHIQAVLGEGGFGVVYRAEDVKLGRNVALKFMRGEVTPLHMKSFTREAKALAALNKHPNILQIHTWGEYNDQCYLALEYLDESVGGLMSRNAQGLAPDAALRIVLQAAEGLSYAHKHGVLHRDIKPGNILIEGEEQRVKLADFGLARLQSSSDGTLVTGVSGSPPYMSPEQASAGEVDVRTDIYSLGVTLYELLSGARPYEGDTASEIIRAVIKNEGVPLRKCRPKMPESILAVVDKATAHAPEERYQDCQDFIAGLRAVLKEITGEEAPPSPVPAPQSVASGRLQLGLLAAAVVLVALVFTIGGGGHRPTEAIAALNDNQPVQAANLFLDFLATNPKSDEARQGLGYAEVLSDKLDAAEAAFALVRDEVKRMEGEAALAYAAGVDDTRAKVERAAEAAGTGYAVTLRALLALEAGETEAARQLLEENLGGSFAFDWQRARNRQYLGEIYFKLGDYAKAAEFIGDAGGPGTAHGAAVKEALLAEIQDREDAAKKAELNAQLARLKELMEDGPPPAMPTPEEQWTSRPVNVVILDAEGVAQRFPVETGLATALPVMLERELLKGGQVEVINRSLLDAMLRERELAHLLDAENQHLMARMLTARLLVRGEFMDQFGPSLFLRLVDAESSAEVLGPDFDDLESADLQVLVAEAADAVEAAARKAYPLQGIATKSGDGWDLNIGSDMGVAVGMEFRVSLSMSQKSMASITATVTAVGSNDATIEFEGPDSISLDGPLYLWQPAEL